MSHNITVESGKSLKLKTAGKYCDRDIVVTAEGGGMVVCELEEPSQTNTIKKINDLKISYPNATSVGEAAFNDCKALTKIDLPIATIIEEDAFVGCQNLKTVNMPLVTTIKAGAFNLCASLKSVNLPSATFVGDRVFANCSSLEYIDLPKATRLGDAPFLYCTNLKAVILRTTETVCAIDIGAFMIDWDDNGMPTIINDKFYIPSSMYEYYRSAYEPAFEEYGFGGYFDIVFHKIEDYPDICGG